MGLADTAKVLLQQARFLVNFDGIESQEYTEVEGLEVSFEDVKTRHGGSRVAYKRPGNIEFGDITLRRDATSTDIDFQLWTATQAELTAAGVGAKTIGAGGDGALRNGEIIALDNDGTELAKWMINGAYVKKYTPGSFKADSNDFVKEELVLGVQFWDRIA
jgi:phage tail-like protein